MFNFLNREYAVEDIQDVLFLSCQTVSAYSTVKNKKKILCKHRVVSDLLFVFTRADDHLNKNFSKHN